MAVAGLGGLVHPRPQHTGMEGRGGGGGACHVMAHHSQGGGNTIMELWPARRLTSSARRLQRWMGNVRVEGEG